MNGYGRRNVELQCWYCLECAYSRWMRRIFCAQYSFPIVEKTVEIGLAQSGWAIAVICLLAIITICVLLIIGMAVLVFFLFQQHMSLKKSLKSQARLLIALNKLLEKNLNAHRGEVDSVSVTHSARIDDNPRPVAQPHDDNTSNSAYHPRNNTPASSEVSFSSHASLPLSALPSLSSESFSEDDMNDESFASTRITAIHPVNERSYMRSREGMVEKGQRTREMLNFAQGSRYERENVSVRTLNRHGHVNLHNGSSTVFYMRNRQFDLSSPKEYWL